MIVAVPADRAVTEPVVLTTVAMEALLLLHVPPAVVSLRLRLLLTHILPVPLIAPGEEGTGLT